MMTIEILFWLFIFLIFYAYLGYPLLLVILVVFLRKPVEKRDITPSVSLLISAYNEENTIKRKIQNSLSLDYPKEKLEIVVISDASTDRTNDIVFSYLDDGVKLLVQPEHIGKTAGLNQAVLGAMSEIIVFTDATAMLRKDTIRKLVRPFADKTIGLVSATTKYIANTDDEMNDGIDIYSRLEQFVKVKEGEIGSIVGAEGSIFAVRKELYEYLNEDLINDLVIPLQIIRKGFRSIMEKDVMCLEERAPTLKGEYRRQVRITNRSLKVLFSELTLLNPFKWKLFALKLFSHKVLKWLVPFLAASTFFLNLLLTFHGTIYIITFLCQISFYLLATIEIISTSPPLRGRARGLFTLPYQFCLVNYAILKGWISFLSGNVETIWTPERGKGNPLS